MNEYNQTTTTSNTKPVSPSGIIIEVGGTYKTSQAIFTIEDLHPCGFMRLRRDDGRIMSFWLADFKDYVVARLAEDYVSTVPEHLRYP